MATNTYVTIPLPEAATLSDIVGVSDDLEAARDFCRRLVMIEHQPPFLDLIDPLTTALVIRYARPFTNGKRPHWPLNEILGELEPQELSLHKLILNLRNLHFAHSVNNFEANQPVARYWRERVYEEGVVSISCLRHRTIGLGIEQLKSIDRLCSRLLEILRLKHDQESSKLLALVRSLPIEEVLSWKQDNPPNDIDPSTPRKSHPKRH